MYPGFNSETFFLPFNGALSAEVEVSLCPNAKPSEKVSWTVWNLQHVVRLRYAKEGCVQCWKGLWVAKGLVDCLLLRETGMLLKTRDRIFSGLVVASAHFYWRGCRNGSKRLFIYLNLENPRGTHFPFLHGGCRHLTKAPARLTDGSKGQRTTPISHKLSDFVVGWLVGGQVMQMRVDSTFAAVDLTSNEFSHRGVSDLTVVFFSIRASWDNSLLIRGS